MRGGWRKGKIYDKCYAREWKIKQMIKHRRKKENSEETYCKDENNERSPGEKSRR